LRLRIGSGIASELIGTRFTMSIRVLSDRGGHVDVEGSFAGRVAVVTGGARGIGDAIVGSFLEEGARVVVLDKREPAQPRDGARYTLADVSDPASVAAAFRSLDDDEGRIDVLVNNAGIQRAGLVGRLRFEDWRDVIGTHLTGMFLCCSEAVPRMVACGEGGAIVSIASVAGFVGLPGRGPYCAAKAGIMGLTRAVSLEVAPLGIRVNAVAPGFTRTELIQQALDDGSLRDDWMLERVPTGRLAEPDEIARVVCFLAGPDARYVTGQTVIVDGGWTVQGISVAPDWLRAGAGEG
jgi:NAD(P)-dependent dehydrogenase (short-subunit alcohol dehydrogenase family)